MLTRELTETVTATAADDKASVVELLRHLVRTPSRGGVDDYAPVVDVVTSWLRNAGLTPRVLTGLKGPVAVVCDVVGATPGPHYVLDACLDTASYGDKTAWTQDPVSAVVDDEGWMYGRGTSDSKAAVSIFCHIAARLTAAPESFCGTATILFDLDEHTGGFAGIRRYLDETDTRQETILSGDSHEGGTEKTSKISGVFIGYPGPDTIVIGGRGFLRAKITVFGQADHSASKKLKVSNAAIKAARLVMALDESNLTSREPGLFGVPPKLTVTSVIGGTPGAFSIVPDRCEVEVDVRLTPDFSADTAWTLLQRTLASIDKAAPAPRRSIIERITEPWPPFKLPHDHPLPLALREAARACGFNPIPVVAGPSNIGNLLASRGIPATAGFGVRYRALHATDEAIDLATIAPVQAIYHQALLTLLSPQV